MVVLTLKSGIQCKRDLPVIFVLATPRGAILGIVLSSLSIPREYGISHMIQKIILFKKSCSHWLHKMQVQRAFLNSSYLNQLPVQCI